MKAHPLWRLNALLGGALEYRGKPFRRVVRLRNRAGHEVIVTVELPPNPEAP